MDKKEVEFKKRLLLTFQAEAREHLRTISSGLLELEKTADANDQKRLVELIFRDAHSLKGAARAVAMTDIEIVCQTLEGVFTVWKRDGVRRSPKIFDQFYGAIDSMRMILSSLEENGPPIDKAKLSSLIRELSRYEYPAPGAGAVDSGKPVGPDEGQRPGQPPKTESATERKRHAHDTVRIPIEKLNALLLQSEELLSTKAAFNASLDGLKGLQTAFDDLKQDIAKSYIEAVSGKNAPISGALRTTGVLEAGDLEASLDRARTQAKKIESTIFKLSKNALAHKKGVERMVDGLLEEVKEAMLLPFSTLLEGFPLLIRHLSHEQGKDVDFTISGADIEADRRILDELKDPLIHIVRNSLDHGIEKPEERATAGKPKRGRLSINISHLSEGMSEIVVSDDGKGIDPDRLKESAVKSGLLNAVKAAGLTPSEAAEFAFSSGVSTSPMITDISGRGLGLAIVREKVERLGGGVTLSSRPNEGLSLKMLVPFTVSTFRGVMVMTGDRRFIIPTSSVERAGRFKDEDIKTVENRETIMLDKCPVSFVRLSDALGLKPPRPVKKARPGGGSACMVLSTGGARIAFGVDEILGELEVLVKPLGPQLIRVRNIAEAAITGTGAPVLVLNVNDLMQGAMGADAFKPAVPPGGADGAEERALQRLLVVEDSITSRVLLKNILEGAGYEVRTAVDGMDAMTLLKTEGFDLVVSDIEMPRMNGFDLTARIRADKKLEETPIVLVTTLESREDREKGINVGANAYIVKSSFNQGNLLDVIKRLI